MTTDLDEIQGLEYSGRYGTAGRSKRGLTKLRQTQRRPRSTFKLGGRPSQMSHVPLEEISPQEASPEKVDMTATS